FCWRGKKKKNKGGENPPLDDAARKTFAAFLEDVRRPDIIGRHENRGSESRSLSRDGGRQNCWRDRTRLAGPAGRRQGRQRSRSGLPLGKNPRLAHLRRRSW